MLRRKPRATSPIDDVDLQLLQGVEAGLRWAALLQRAPCGPEEAAMRILRLIQQGHIEGTPGEAEESPPPHSIHTAVTQPPPSTARFTHRPTARLTRGGSAPSTPERPAVPASGARASAPDLGMQARASSPTAEAPRSVPPATKTVPPGALAAREALMRELTRRSGASFPPVAPASWPSELPRGSSAAPGYYSMTTPSGASSVPPPASDRPQSAPASPVRSTPAGRYSVQPGDRPSVTSSAPPSAGHRDVDSPLASLIEELAGGADLQRWCAARLREAFQQDLSGDVQQALATIQVVMAQLNDPRIRVERDRLHAKSLRAASGVYRARALRAESASRHEEAAESWRKVLEACPDDAEAALHAAMCSMEAGNLRQAGVHARRAVELEPNSVIAHKLLLRFFRKTGMELNANREREILRKLAVKR
jgi:hypothetical protein